MINLASLTVIIPLYNGSKYIRDVLRCIEAQTRDEFRVLYVDDGSSDDTAQIVLNEKRERDELIFKRNTGLYDTLNFSVEQVDTDWTAFLFQDDRTAPTWAENIGRYACNATDCLWFAIDTIGEAGELLARGLDTSRVEAIRPSETTWQSALKRGTFWTISGSALRTETLRSMRFRSDLPHCADYEFLLRGLERLTFTYIEKSLVQIRCHQGAASTRNLASGSDIDERLTVLLDELRTASYTAPFPLRADLAAGMIRQTFLRAAGAARRGVVPDVPRVLRRARRAAELLWAGG